MLDKIKKQSIYKLVYKEIIVMRFKFWAVLLIGVFLLMGMRGGAYAPIMAVVCSTLLFIQLIFSVYNKNQTEILLNSLPVSRREMVLAKYIVILGFMLLMLVLITGLQYLNEGTYLYWLGITILFGYFPPVTLGQIMVTLGLSLVAIALTLPANLKYGGYKMQVYNSIMFGVFLLGPILLMIRFISAQETQSIFMETQIHYPLLWSGVFLIGAIIILVVSFWLALRFNEKRECY